MVRRRTLLASAAALGTAAAIPGALWLNGRAVAGTLNGADAKRGHALRDRKFPRPTETEEVDILIAGGGVAGLSAGWSLAEAGITNFQLLELEDQTGGNARSGENAICKYPLGAHYLPIPNQEARALRHMLSKLGMIIGEKQGKPVYDPYQLCADLQERLFWRGRWQEGLFPTTGLSAKDKADRAGFDTAMADFARALGSDGRPAFAVPSPYSSADPIYTALDDQNFADWLDAKGWTSPVLRAHIRYCCRDDYGCEPKDTSAWAGIHYFAGRRGWAADGVGDGELTWPEGNARLTNAMAARFPTQLRAGRTAFVVQQNDKGVEVDSYDHKRGISIRSQAKAVILAMPHFVASRVAEIGPSTQFSYAPWLVASISVDKLPVGRGAKLAWDNVSSTSESLGYVVATHQSRGTGQGPSVLSWYLPLSNEDPVAARKRMLMTPLADWQQRVRVDLLAMHPELDDAITRIDIWLWGHGMIRPTPGFISRTAPAAAARVKPPLFLAHSDMSGLSLFEEAHYRGVASAEAAMRHLSHPFESLI
jgi:phytoene dehydrogenase-like protein